MATLRAFTPEELRLLQEMMERGVRCPRTSSAGRLFDAVASIVELRQLCRFEGQAAMELEFLTRNVQADGAYPFTLVSEGASLSLDWAPAIRAIVEDVHHEVRIAVVATKFHNTLVEMMVKVAQAAGEEKITLSGGCFQNRYLTETAIKRLREEGFRPYWHQRVPPNDGGIALGQVVAAARALQIANQEEGQTTCALQFQGKS